jgi:hypothetical protein
MEGVTMRKQCSRVKIGGGRSSKQKAVQQGQDEMGYNESRKQCSRIRMEEESSAAGSGWKQKAVQQGQYRRRKYSRVRMEGVTMEGGSSAAGSGWKKVPMETGSSPTGSG